MLKKFVFPLATLCLLLLGAAIQNNGLQAQGADDGKHFGAAVTFENAISYDQLMPKMENVESMPAKVVGKVSSVCQVKGCWMTLTSEDPSKPEMRVTFKDYAFFMPKDLAGKHVLIEGTAFVDVTSVDDLRHYAEDAGKSKEEIAKITEPKRELTFEAAGVLILD